MANGLNQHATIAGAAVTYDKNGNLTGDPGAVTGAASAVTLVYDIENRLVSASGGRSASLVYDPLGRLSSLTSGGNTTRFLYDGDALVAEYDGAGTLLHRYVHGVGADVPLMQYDGATVSIATRRYLLADARGSIVAITDGSSLVQNRNSYDEYGVPAAANAGRFQYTGQIWLAEVGIYHYKRRMYSPYEGRFLQVDAVGYRDQFNLYAYVANDPVNGADPAGAYTCNGSAENCEKVRGYRQLIQLASRSRTIAEGQRRLLQGVLNTLGRPGERNGVTVNFGNLPGNAAGFGDPSSPGQGTITLDIAMIERAGDDMARLNGVDATTGRYVSGAETLAHEGAHVWYGPVSTVGEILQTERMGYLTGYSTLQGLGVGSRVGWQRGISGREMMRRVEQGAIRSCQFHRQFYSICAEVGASE